MIFSLEWLKELSGYKGSASALADQLSGQVAETETESSTRFDGIIYAKVTKIDKHPNADRLRVVELTDGKKTIRPVVCGAWNFDIGAIVPLALPGAVIPHNQHDPDGKPFVLGKAVIRNVESQGMICSGKELGLSDDGNGIMVLKKEENALGQTFVAQKQADTIEISVPANRPDLVSYLGVAREITALSDGKLNFNAKQLKKPQAKSIKLKIADNRLCARYVVARFLAVKVKPSPAFIQERLKASGLRPINNIVDITNYVMLLTGQPMHAFDSEKIGSSIIVRKAYLNESIVTLDGETRKLNPETLVIADAKKAQAIAGIIGGKQTAVSDNTNSIILESANFSALSVRKTSRDLGVRTDASIRFEKNLSPALTDLGITIAAELLSKYAGAQLSEYAAVGNVSANAAISASEEQINNLIGLKIPFATQKKILAKMGFTISGGKNKFKATPPDFRTDIRIWEDIAEEILRVFGIDNIAPAQAQISGSNVRSDKAIGRKRLVSDVLKGLGFDEIYTYSFISRDEAKVWEIPAGMLVEVANPLSADQQFMRPNLVINHVKVAEHNAKNTESGSFFEIGNAYWKEGKVTTEKAFLCMTSYGKSYPSELLAGAVLEMSRRLRMDLAIKQQSEQMAVITADEQEIGKVAHMQVGEIKWLSAHIDFENLAARIKEPKFSAFSKYPSKILDVSMLVRKNLGWAEVEKLAERSSELIRRIELVDIYTGKNIPPHKKSLTFRIVYQAMDRTLEDDEVDKIHSKILQELKAKFNAEVRD